MAALGNENRFTGVKVFSTTLARDRETMGENITTRGLDRRSLRIGHRFRIGTAEIALTRVRTPCATLGVYGAGIQAAIYDARVQAGEWISERWGASGFYGAVTRPGTVRPGDPIALVG